MVRVEPSLATAATAVVHGKEKTWALPSQPWSGFRKGKPNVNSMEILLSNLLRFCSPDKTNFFLVFEIASLAGKTT